MKMYIGQYPSNQSNVFFLLLPKDSCFASVHSSIRKVHIRTNRVELIFNAIFNHKNMEINRIAI